jgi:hypothetical protein
MSRFLATDEDVNERRTLRERMSIRTALRDAAHDQQNEPATVLDADFRRFTGFISGFMTMLEFDDSSSQAEPVLPKLPHERTTYEPFFVDERCSTPEPLSYNPEYEAVAPRPLLTTIMTVPTTVPRMEDSSTREIADHFTQNVRGFQRSEIKPLNDRLRTPFIEKDHRVHPTFEQQRPRADISKPLGTDLDFIDVPAPVLKVALFDTQRPRVEAEPPIEGRDYSDKANAQLRKLQGECKIPVFESQFDRNFVAPPNQRLEFIAGLREQQVKMLEKFRPRRSGSVASRKLVETFPQQLAREQAVNSYRKSDTFGESRWDCDPLKSLQKIWPRTRTVVIRSPTNRERALGNAGPFAAAKP